MIDIAVLRTTLMETGQWVKAEQYNGRIVRIANSFVFKEPVFNYSADFPFLWDELTLRIKNDNVLRTLAGIIMKQLRQTDSIARLGGDEFAILFSETPQSATRPAIARIQQEFARVAQSHNWRVTFSAGALVILCK